MDRGAIIKWPVRQWFHKSILGIKDIDINLWFVNANNMFYSVK